MRTLDIFECADFLKIDRTTALKLAGEGELPGARIGRAWVFLEDDLVEYLRAKARQQAAERMAETRTNKTLQAASKRNPPDTLITLNSDKRRAKRLTMSDLPELDRQVGSAQVGVAG